MKSLRMLVGLLGSPWKHVLGPGLPVLMWDHGRLLLLLEPCGYSLVKGVILGRQGSPYHRHVVHDIYVKEYAPDLCVGYSCQCRAR